MRNVKKILLDAAWEELYRYERMKEEEYDYYGSLASQGIIEDFDFEEMDRSIASLDKKIGLLIEKISDLVEEAT